MEKCSESIGSILVLYFFLNLDISDQPQIIDSLFAIATVLLILIASSVGCNPAIPTIAEIV